MIFIKPYYHLERLQLDEKIEVEKDWLWENKEYLFFFSGKRAIHFLINKLGLKKEDEVCIITTTGSNYVSTCVSATIFNYCKISRVITDNTKLIYAIHEFGFPVKEINELVLVANRRGIPLVEDCAHTIYSYQGDRRVGTFGDYTIYSLSKHLPIENCGLLVGKNLKKDLNEYYEMEIANELEREYFKYLPYLKPLAQQKISNAKTLFRSLNELVPVLETTVQITPHLLVFNNKYFNELYSLTKKIIEPHPLHVKNWFAIPIQPLMRLEEVDEIVNTINSFILQKKLHE